ncbi:HIG1 domain family member 1A, mitochondrial [Megachile rotundata]|uniref:HIG1 domain family member 1A, mitochondrial n=1 Tax=Megachile rotundata TaxID=143995 RepID=UPI000258E975|nr:PREDICTED: HIG1 domain family member 1A, mitochondrial-like [Megachile rotundata]XP_012147030.1 PREDICTED: HIG1 domain family member 1A, mitochondrial-like [Megachile rotundata]
MDKRYINAEPMEIPEEAIRQTLENEQGFGDRLYTQIQRAPFAAAGLLGLSIVCGIGAYKWKTRTIPPQLFLIQLRVAAQSTALGFITIGLAYQMYKNYVNKEKPT